MDAKHHITGFHAVEMVLSTQPQRVRELVVLRNAKPHASRQALMEQANQAGIPVVELDREFFERLSDGQNVQGIAAKVGPFPYANLGTLCSEWSGVEHRLVLILDGVTDPHNLGAILRTAAFFGADGVILPKDRSAHVTPVVERIAAGGAAEVPVTMVPNLSRAMGQLKESGFWVYGTVEAGGVGLEEVNLEGKTALVLGAEGAGMRRLTRERCDGLLTLSPQGKIPALNVSVFAGVVVYEVVRQRQKAKVPAS